MKVEKKAFFLAMKFCIFKTVIQLSASANRPLFHATQLHFSAVSLCWCKQSCGLPGLIRLTILTCKVGFTSHQHNDAALTVWLHFVDAE